MLECTYDIPKLPLDVDVETRLVLKHVAAAYRAISDMRREAARVPNQSILIDTLALQEAQASSEIENIITTQDELFRMGPSFSHRLTPEQKEVGRYRDSLLVGQRGLTDAGGLITLNTIVSVFRTLKDTTDAFRRMPGTTLTHETTKQVIYVPPQHHSEIMKHMSALEDFINRPETCDWDPLVKMAIVHHQFESIHPFSDGNGRVGRILNVLYLVQQGIIELPILYLSRYITQTKPDYYRLLQSVRESGNWEDWVIYMVRGIAATARETEQLLSGINALLIEYKDRMRREHGSAYSHELLNTLFRHPYTRIDNVVEEASVSRQTAAKYLDALADSGLVAKVKLGRTNYFINEPLVQLFYDRPRMV